jgi:hypothetical protein
MYAQNVKASEQVAVLALVAPSSQAIGTSVSGWISAANFQKYLAKIQAGVLGASGTVNASFQQAQDNAGTGAKAVGVAIAPITVNNQCALLELDAQQLDVEGGFGFIELSVTVGTAASETSAALFGFNPRYAPASAYNAAAVTQVVG